MCGSRPSSVEIHYKSLGMNWIKFVFSITLHLPLNVLFFICPFSQHQFFVIRNLLSVWFFFQWWFRNNPRALLKIFLSVLLSKNEIIVFFLIIAVWRILFCRPEVFMSKDQKTIICYHPPPKPYPEQYTKVCENNDKSINISSNWYRSQYLPI